MSHRSGRNLLSMLGLALLTVVAAGLSGAALLPVRPTATDTIPTPSPTKTVSTTPSPSPELSENDGPTSTPESTSGDTDSAGEVVVVVLGDQYSEADTPDVWVNSVAKKLHWNSVTNLSSSGRGYVKKPLNCDIDVCSTFGGTISLIAEKNPDVVITFGGAADGDNDLSEAAAKYYADLREALPEAELVAISPVTSEDEAEYWLTMHNRTIRSAVEAVGGTFVDVGQPGVGDGDKLSKNAQNQVADDIVEALS